MKHKFNRVAIACLTFLLLSSTLFMLTASSVKADSPPTTQIIQGTVYDQDTGLPISGASIIVNLADGSAIYPTVDSSGAYSTTFTTDNPPISIETHAQNYYTQSAMDMPTTFDQPITRDFYMQLSNPVLDQYTTNWVYSYDGPYVVLSLSTSTPNELVYVAVASPSTQPVASVTSNPDLTWTQRQQVTYDSGSENLETWYAVAPQTGNIQIDVSFNVPNIDNKAVFLAFSIRGNNATNPFDGHPAVNTGQSDSPTVTTSATTPNDLILGILGTGNLGQNTGNYLYNVNNIWELYNSEYVNGVWTTTRELLGEDQTCQVLKWSSDTFTNGIGQSTDWAMIADAVNPAMEQQYTVYGSVAQADFPHDELPAATVTAQFWNSAQGTYDPPITIPHNPDSSFHLTYLPSQTPVKLTAKASGYCDTKYLVNVPTDGSIESSIEIEMIQSVGSMYASDTSGNAQSIFQPNQDLICATVTGVEALNGQQATFYIAPHQQSWNDGDLLSDVTGYPDQTWLSYGTFTYYLWWPTSANLGTYDIVLDLNNNGVFDQGIDQVVQGIHVWTFGNQQCDYNVYVNDAANGNPIQGADVSVSSATFSQSQTIYGNMECYPYLSDFPLTVQVSAPGYISQTVTVDNPNGETDLTTDIQLQSVPPPTFQISGTISDGSTMTTWGVTPTPIAGATVTLDFGGSQPTQTLVTNSSGQFQSTYEYLGGDYGFSIQATISAPGYITYSGTFGYPSDQGDIDLSTMIYPPNYEFPVTFHIGNLLANDLDPNGNPVPYAQIHVAPNNGPVTQVYTTDANGEVTIDFFAYQLPVAMNFTAQGFQDPGGPLGSYTLDEAYWPLANANTYIDIIPLQTAQVQTATGTGTATFTPGIGQVNGLTAVLPSTLPQAGLPSGLTFPDGLFNYTIAGTPPFTYLNWGQIDTLNITLPSTVPANAQYWMYTAGQGWVQVPIQSINGNTVTLKLTDGGTGDAINYRDYQIVDLGGIGYVLPTINLNPTSGQPGSTVTVSGSNFEPNTLVHISVAGAGQVAATMSDATGAISTSFIVPPMAIGNVAVYATDGVSTAQATLTIMSSAPSVSVSVSPSAWTMDAGQSETFTASASGGSGSYTGYQWYVNGVSQFGETALTFSFTPASAGSYSITATVTDSTGATSTQSSAATVTVYSALVAPTVTPAPGTVDQGQTSALTSTTVSTGSGGYVYQWLEKAPGGSYVAVGTSSASFSFVTTGSRPRVFGALSFK